MYVECENSSYSFGRGQPTDSLESYGSRFYDFEGSYFLQLLPRL